MKDAYFLGRQPIVDSNRHIYAYELLFRSGDVASANVVNDVQASAEVMLNTLTAFGLSAVVGEAYAFFNVDESLLMADTIELLPKEQVVIELLETIVITPAVVERCRVLKERGFRLALDDHEADEATFAELYSIVDIIKVDIMLTPREELASAVELFSRYNLRLLAEKIETAEEYEYCRSLGFSLFQGYYFAKPVVLKQQKLDVSRTSVLRLMSSINDDVPLSELEEIFRRDANLTYGLLKLVNSVAFGIKQKITSLRHAMSMLGLKQLRRWLVLALLSSDDSTGGKNPLLAMACFRGKFMESCANLKQFRGVMSDESREQAFMTGVLSCLDSVYPESRDDILKELNLIDEIMQALYHREGVLGKLLVLTEAVEGGDFEKLEDSSKALSLDSKDVLEAQIGALAWSEEVQKAS